MSAKTNDNVYLAIGGLAILGAGIWAFVQQSEISALRGTASAPTSGATYEPTSIAVSSPASETWQPAPAQTAGEKWIYDVFTPPKIYYNTQTKQFTVVPPAIKDPEVIVGPVGPQPFGLELVGVEQPLFRLQLVGYVGEGEQARGNFLNTKTGAIIFGTTGKKLSDLNLEIVNFSAERRVVPQAGGTTLVFTEVSAVVRDTETGVETKLDSRTRVPEGPLVATFKLPDGSELRAKAGERITVGERSYQVGDLTLMPPTAVATKEAIQGAEPETKTLVVPPPAPPASENPVPDETMPEMMPPGTFPGF